MILLKLFISFLQIGAFSFGGGYAAMPLIQHQVVELHQWLSMVEFSDLITISQITPGPNICWFKNKWFYWGISSYNGLYYSFMYYCLYSCLYLFKISTDVDYSKYFEIYSSCSCSNDWWIWFINYSK